MTIVLMVEGDTEAALRQHLKAFLDRRAEAAGKPCVRLETRDLVNLAPHRLGHRVGLELHRPDVTAVVGLIDVYPKFKDAAEAKAYLADAAGQPGFYAHAAQYDVEAWLLPYWDDICRRLGVNQGPPGGNPELVNALNPPAYRLQELYRRARPRPRKYVKTIEMYAILQGKDLTVAAEQCAEFKAFLNTLLTLGGLEPLG
ncbi:MAG: DUF4276 family protein [Anaerolineae bacterium]|nr:DUF4276 family protein [Anaerolineae bacterium]